jgi:thiol-disulfide isomerase/thioredoxin
MNKYHLILFLLLASFTLPSYGGGINFRYDSTFAQALSEARLENKLIFMDCYASWCGPCRRLAATVFMDSIVGDYFNSHYINVRFDMEMGDGINIARRYHIYAYPTLLWIDSIGNVINTQLGCADVDTLMKVAKNVHYTNISEITNIEFVNIYPNPISSRAEISIKSDIAQDLVLSLNDLSGRLIFKETIHIDNGISQREINVAKLNNGIYICTLSDAGQVQKAMKILVLK